MRRLKIHACLAALVLTALSAVPAMADLVTISDLSTLQATIEAASGPRTIEIAAGTYTLPANINLDQPNITIQGQGTLATQVQVSGTGYRFSVTAAGCTIRNLDLLKTDHTGGQDIIWLNADNATVRDNRIHGQFVIGDPETVRGMVVSGGHSGMLITGNTFYALRQPGYISGSLTPSPAGTISSNNVYGTKGWVLEGGNTVFTGNTWGTGANANVYDIAIIAAMQPAFYTDIVAVSNANNGAVIEDQRPSPAILSVVAVDAAAAPGGAGSPLYPYQTIGAAIARVAPGGTIHVAAGTYAGPGGIGAAMTLLGPNAAICGHDAARAPEAIINSGSPAIRVGTTAPVVIKGFRFDGIAGTAIDSYTAGTNITLQNDIFTNINTGALYFNSGNTFSFDCNEFSNITDTNAEGMFLAGNWNGSTGTTASITNNVFENTISTVMNLSSVNATITGNRFTHDNYYGVLLANNCGGSTITGNTFDGMVNPDPSPSGSGSWGAGVRFYTPANTTPVSITGNHFLNSYAGVAVRVGGDITGQPISVTENDFVGNTYGIRNLGTGTLAASCNWFGSVSGPNVVPSNPSPGDLVEGPVTWAPSLTGATPAGVCNGYGTNYVAPVTAGLCLSNAHTCVTVPVVFTRADVSNARGVSVTLALSSNLRLCDQVNLKNNFHQGSWIGAAANNYEVVDHHDGTYDVDQAILGLPCGITTGGTLFSVDVQKVPGSLDGDGTLTVSNVVVRDCDNAPLPGIAGAPGTVHIDFTLPTAISALTAVQQKSGNTAPPTTNLTLTFTAPSDAAVIEVYRAPFGGTVAGTYPEYTGSAPSVPSYPPGAPWVLTSVTTSGSKDNPGVRGFWYYVAFCKDACGNTSLVSNVTNGKLDYFLGDVSNGLVDCMGDDLVGTGDISALGGHYGATLALVDPLACLDVGPTTSGSVDARPVPDNKLGFEDLMMYAINFSVVSAPQFAAVPVVAGGDALKLDAPAHVSAGQTFTVTLRFQGGGDVQGLSTQLGWDRAIAEPVAVTAGDLVTAQGGVVFSAAPGNADAAVLGTGRGIAGDGVLATVTFQATASGDPRIAIASADARDTQNQKVTLSGGAGPAPTQTALLPAMPNPFNGSTALAFSLARGGRADVAVFSVDGRRVKVLASGSREAGQYRLAWDGTDDSGRAVRSGMYFIRLSTSEGHFSRTLVLAR